MVFDLNWTEAAKATIAKHIQQLHEHSDFSCEDLAAVARAAGGLPVYSDAGGYILLTPKGEVLAYETETDTLNAQVEERWRIVAAISAAERYPDLRQLLPQRPSTALTCSTCAGAGKLYRGLVCGTCLGLGWVNGSTMRTESK